MLTNEEIEDFIAELDKNSANMCVNPEHQSLDCQDCYLCRVDFFNWVREDLKKWRMVESIKNLIR